jgi:glycosyltransferase involved in cell wall biosynthesis
MVDGIVVNCEAIRRHLLDDEGVPPHLIHVCPNGIDGNVFRPETRSRPPRGVPLRIGTVGVLRPEKAVEHLLDAFAAVSRVHPQIMLVIVGSGPSLGVLQARCDALGLSSACQFVPATNNVAQWLHDIDIFVLSSVSEALSNALMEAMACGCAVVASDVGGNSELVTHDRTGLLVERANPEALSAALRRLIEQPALRADVGITASCFIHENFSLSAAAKGLASLYSRLLSAGRRTAIRPC